MRGFYLRKSSCSFQEVGQIQVMGREGRFRYFYFREDCLVLNCQSLFQKFCFLQGKLGFFIYICGRVRGFRWGCVLIVKGVFGFGDKLFIVVIFFQVLFVFLCRGDRFFYFYVNVLRVYFLSFNQDFKEVVNNVLLFQDVVV